MSLSNQTHFCLFLSNALNICDVSCESKRIVHRLASPLCAGRARELALSDGAPSPTAAARRLRSNGPSGPAVRSSSPRRVFPSGGICGAPHRKPMGYLFIYYFIYAWVFIYFLPWMLPEKKRDAGGSQSGPSLAHLLIFGAGRIQSDTQ